MDFKYLGILDIKFYFLDKKNLSRFYVGNASDIQASSRCQGVLSLKACAKSSARKQRVEKHIAKTPHAPGDYELFTQFR
jgi:hypothetical protein